MDKLWQKFLAGAVITLLTQLMLSVSWMGYTMPVNTKVVISLFTIAGLLSLGLGLLAFIGERQAAERSRWTTFRRTNSPSRG